MSHLDHQKIIKDHSKLLIVLHRTKFVDVFTIKKNDWKKTSPKMEVKKRSQSFQV